MKVKHAKTDTEKSELAVVAAGTAIVKRRNKKSRYDPTAMEILQIVSAKIVDKAESKVIATQFKVSVQTVHRFAYLYKKGTLHEHRTLKEAGLTESKIEAELKRLRKGEAEVVINVISLPPEQEAEVERRVTARLKSREVHEACRADLYDWLFLQPVLTFELHGRLVPLMFVRMPSDGFDVWEINCLLFKAWWGPIMQARQIQK